MRRSRAIPVLIGLLVLVGANAVAYRKWYVAPVQEKRAELERVEEQIHSIRNRTTKLMEGRADLRSAAAMTLGRTVQTAEERLRSTLNELLRTTGLEGAKVDTRVDRNPTVNPASAARLDAYRRRDERGRIRSTPEPGFTRIVATVTGSGATRAVLDTVSLVESQRWLNRITRLKVDPRDGGARMDVVMEIETIFIPERSPETGPGLTPMDAARAEIASTVLARSPFSAPEPAEPAPVVRAEEAAKVEPTGPESPEYRAWKVAFLREGASGPELTIRRDKPAETKVLRVGDRFHDMVFRGFERLDAIFEIDGERFRVGVGQNLAGRDNPEVVQ